MSSESPSAKLGAQQPALDEIGTWHAGPIVVESSGCSTDRVHAPDTRSDEVSPACKISASVGVDDEREWVAKRLTGGLAAFRRPCGCPNCENRVRDLADELEVSFDGC